MSASEDTIPLSKVIMMLAPGIQMRFPGTIITTNGKSIDVSITGSGSSKNLVMEIYNDHTFYVSRACGANSKNLRDVTRAYRTALEIVEIFQLTPSIVPKNQ